MNFKRTVEVLEALASGCSPSTGETIADESILNEREVIRALQVAIDEVRKNVPQDSFDVEIEESDIIYAVRLFRSQKQGATVNKLASFFSATRKFKNEKLVSDPMYGKYKNLYQKGQLLDFFTEYFSHKKQRNEKSDNEAWRDIDFFKKPRFNKLTEAAIEQLKERVNELGVLKTENLSDNVLASRIKYPRAYESWSEKELLRKALLYTNELTLLSSCFQRGRGSIESCGKRLMFEEIKNC